MTAIKSERFFFVLPSLAHGGAQSVFVQLYNQFKKSGLDATLVVLDRDGELYSQIQDDYSVVYLDQNPFGASFMKRPVQFWRLRQLLKKAPPCTVFSTITGNNIFVLLASLFIRHCTVIIREASTRRNVTKASLSFLSKCTYPWAKALICTSTLIRHEMIEQIGVLPERAVVIANPVDGANLRALARTREHALVLFKGEPGIKLVAIGRLIEAKGFDVLIEAFSLLRKNGIEAVLTIVGEGPERNKIEALVSELGLSDRVLLAGYQANPYPFLEAADIFVLSSRWEGYVNVLIEAMVFNKPTVVTDCKSGPGELLNKHLGQELVPVDNSVALAEKLLEVISNGEKPNYEGLLAMHRIDRIANEYVEIGRAK